MRFEIEKGIPLSEPWGWDYEREFRENISWPFHRMEVGDSFKVREGRAERARSAASSHARRHGGKFTTRRVSTLYFRVWRIE